MAIDDTEVKLVSAAKMDNRQAFDELLAVHSAQIKRHIKKRYVSPNDEDDVFQQTSLKAWRKIKEFRADSRFSTWLFSIATNCITDYFRNLGANKNIPLRESVSIDSGEQDSNGILNPNSPADIQKFREDGEPNIGLEEESDQKQHTQQLILRLNSLLDVIKQEISHVNSKRQFTLFFEYTFGLRRDPDTQPTNTEFTDAKSLVCQELNIPSRTYKYHLENYIEPVLKRLGDDNAAVKDLFELIRPRRNRKSGQRK